MSNQVRNTKIKYSLGLSALYHVYAMVVGMTPSDALAGFFLLALAIGVCMSVIEEMVDRKREEERLELVARYALEVMTHEGRHHGTRQE